MSISLWLLCANNTFLLPFDFAYSIFWIGNVLVHIVFALQTALSVSMQQMRCKLAIADFVEHFCQKCKRWCNSYTRARWHKYFPWELRLEIHIQEKWVFLESHVLHFFCLPNDIAFNPATLFARFCFALLTTAKPKEYLRYTLCIK